MVAPAWFTAGCAYGTRHQVRPVVQVLTGIADHGGFAGGAAGGVHANHLFTRHREHAEGVVIAQILLGGERKLRQIFQLLQVIRMHARCVEDAAVMRHVRVRMRQRPPQALQLQCLYCFDLQVHVPH